MGIAPLKWAFWMLLLLFLIVFLFESKRRQRLVPVIGALRNTSLDFVKTIRRLYYQRRDNHNRVKWLPISRIGAHGIIWPPLKWMMVRDRVLQDRAEPEYVQDLVGAIEAIQYQLAVPDDELLAFEWKMKEFYKQV